MPMTSEFAAGTVVGVCLSEKRGGSKRDVGSGVLRAGWGLEGDAHAGPWHRQVSLLGVESIAKGRARGFDVGPGSYAENITTRGLELYRLPIGAHLSVGEALLEVTQIGKQEREPGSIQRLIGDSAIPREGIFARVLEGGRVETGDQATVVGGPGPAFESN